MSNESGLILRVRDVEIKTGLSKSTIRRRIFEGNFPKAKKLGGRSVGWWSHDVDEWIKNLPFSS